MTTAKNTKSRRAFVEVANAAVERRRLIPSVKAYLNDPDFPAFHVPVRSWQSGRRTHDGWWHPSTHAGWDQRKLFYYLAYPDQFIPEEMPAEGIKAVTAGSFWGEFYQIILLRTQHAIPHNNPKGMNPAELSLKSEPHRVRGHADGELRDMNEWVDELLELKSINEFQVEKIFDEEVLREKKPGYYGQSQDYLWMHFGPGIGVMRYLIVHPGYPFTEMEFTVEANLSYQRKRMQMYEETWDMVQAHQAGETVSQFPRCRGCDAAIAQLCEVREPCPVGAPA